jgi:ferric-dicitrate binding protein FerR (iron transport regulator)
VTRLAGLFRQIRDEQDALRADSGLEERLVARIRRAPLPSRRSRRTSWLSLAAALALLAVAGVGSVVFRERPPLDLKVGSGTGAPALGTWVGAPESKSLPLEFSDGSRFELAPKATARLVALERNGARIELASGSMKVEVVPRAQTNFRLDAGPFGVRVTGTRFELSYSPERDAFELYLEEGQVELTGCVFGQGKKLAAGQSVRASCRKPAVDVSYGRPRQAPDSLASTTRATASEKKVPDGANAPRVAEAQVAARVPPPVPSAPGKPADESWVALARTGAYDEAFSAARSKGFEAECTRADAATLALLADVARHARAPRQAEHALLTLRARFPKSNEAAVAAFTLGRLEFDDYRSYRRAASWFKTYLAERPSGGMTREALGRLMEASYRAKDLEGARDAASRYLRDYPSGPHAELASRVVASR